MQKTNTWRICLFIAVFILNYISSSLGQEKAKLPKARFIEISAGMNRTSFTDFATSPLPYSGVTPVFSLAFSRISERRENKLSASFITGNLSVIADGKMFLSNIQTPFLSYSRLYKLPVKLGSKWNLKVGGLIDLTANYRINKDLQNNSFGLEMFHTLFGSGKISRDISRNREKKGRLMYIPYHLFPRKRFVSYQLNLPIVNNVYRNGFAYSNSSSIINNYSLGKDYQYKWFSGLRLSSEFAYDLYYPNGNIIRLAFKWDAYKSGGELDLFQMAHHSLQLALLFRTK